MKQKRVSKSSFKYDLDIILKCLYAIRNDGEFYFMAYGREFLGKLIDQELGLANLESKGKLFDFVVAHKTDCYRAFSKGVSHHDYKSDEGKKIVSLARKSVGYSPKTWDGDIYRCIFNVYKSIVIDGTESPEEIKP